MLLVLAGPSGVGKGTIVTELLTRLKKLKVSISVTTRPKRSMEVDGVDYFFKTPEEFADLVKRGEMLEYAKYNSFYYGTPRKYVVDNLMAGFDVVLEIDVQGALQVKKQDTNSVLIFIKPPSMDELERRLRSRQTETAENIEKRLKIAKSELERVNEFKYVIVNDNVQRATGEIIEKVFCCVNGKGGK
jgi:guanylate kinase